MFNNRSSPKLQRHAAYLRKEDIPIKNPSITFDLNLSSSKSKRCVTNSQSNHFQVEFANHERDLGKGWVLLRVCAVALLVYELQKLVFHPYGGM